MSIKNIDTALSRRDAERKQQYLSWLKSVRADAGTVEFDPRKQTADGETNTTYVTANDLYRAACTRMQRANVILDIGCGINPQPFLEPQIHICSEPYQEYMDRLMIEKKDDCRFVFLQCDLKETVRLFPARSVDTVFLTDVIEHLDRKEAMECLQKLKCIVRRQLVLFTPLGFMPQDPLSGENDHWGMQGAEWQKHKSGWLPEDFPAEDGWEVIACKQFHFKDAYGRDLEKPIGAMWAIRTSNGMDQ